jgi:hypothetical protein
MIALHPSFSSVISSITVGFLMRILDSKMECKLGRSQILEFLSILGVRWDIDGGMCVDIDNLWEEDIRKGRIESLANILQGYFSKRVSENE